MFVPCRSCRRHVRAGDAACPFCAAACDPAPVTTPSVTVRATRAMLAAAAFGVAIAGCRERPPAPVYGGPPEPMTQPTPEDAAPIEPTAEPTSVPSSSTAANAPTTEPPPSIPGGIDAAVPAPTTIPAPPGKPMPGPPVAMYGAPPPPVTP